MEKRTLKDTLYEQVARIGKAVSSPKRLELLELLAQGEKTVELLAAELSVDVKLTSAHLRALRQARLVDTRRDGKYVVYRLSGHDVAGLWVMLRQVAESHLAELRLALDDIAARSDELVTLGRQELLAQARRGDVIVIDVRPQEEFDTAHLPCARSLPLGEIEQRIDGLPRDKDIIAYCRGPFCLFADEAVALLQSKGYRARKMSDGVSDWRAAGMPVVESGADSPAVQFGVY